MGNLYNYLRGDRSVYPTSIDSYGNEHTNDVCELISAERYNFIGDTLNRIQFKTLYVLQTGTSFYTHAVTGTNRPKVLIKAFSVSIIGSGASLKTGTISGPLFTAAEKTLFGGTPLASGNCIHIQARKSPGDAALQKAYVASVAGPIADTSGDSGLTVGISPLASGLGNVEAGTYIVSFFITSNN